MSSNIRSKPIEGHVTDSAGNVLRNARIVIKQVTPGGSYSIGTSNSDDGGYFISKPVPSGTYDIYESGIRISRTMHNSDKNSIQCYKPIKDNYNQDIVSSFNYLLANGDPNNFRWFIQIESPELDVAQYGSSFPIYDRDLSSNPNLADAENDLWHISEFFSLSSESRVTTTRFDIEYFLPITALSNTYKRIRWSGVPGIRFFQDSKIVVPIDYFSMVLNNPKSITPAGADFTAAHVTITDSGSSYTLNNPINNTEFSSLARVTSPGDVLELTIGSDKFYGIVSSVSSSSGVYSMSLKQLKSSRYETTATITSGVSVNRIFAYDGIFENISNINEDVNERFTVVENIYAQNNKTELYSYVNQ